MNYKPEPLNTEMVCLSEDIKQLIELLAKNAHDVWAEGRIKDGWTHGSVRDDGKKQHPCLIPYEKLPESEKKYDRNIAEETIKAILSLGYSIEKEEKVDEYQY